MCYHVNMTDRYTVQARVNAALYKDLEKIANRDFPQHGLNGRRNLSALVRAALVEFRDRRLRRARRERETAFPDPSS